MAEKEWYYYQNGESRGPVTFAELQGLVAGGQITPGDLVSKAGMTSWMTASQVEGLMPQGSAPPPPPPAGVGPGLGDRLRMLGASDDLVESMPHLRLVQRFLEMIKGVFSETLLNGIDRWAKAVGSIALLAAASFLLLSLLVLGIRGNAVPLLLGGLIGVPLVTVLVHFLAARFLDAGRSLLRESPSAFSSSAFLQCLGLALFVAAVLALLGGLVTLVQGKFLFAIPALAAAPIYLYLCGVALNPGLVNVQVGQRATAGEEAISILMFLFKLPLRLVPFVFGVGMVAALLGTGYLFFKSVASEPFFAMLLLPTIGPGLVGVALFPIVAYLVFLFLYLLVDLLRAVLVVPGKLDALREK